MRNAFIVLIILGTSFACAPKPSIDPSSIAQTPPATPRSTKTYASGHPANEQEQQLIAASRMGDSDTVKELLDKGVSPQGMEQGGDLPLLVNQGRSEEDFEIQKLLLAKGADPNARNEQGWTPLTRMMSISAWDTGKFVELLLANGADIDFAGPSGLTPLHFAVRFGQEDRVKQLIKGGANVRIVPSALALKEREKTEVRTPETQVALALTAEIGFVRDSGMPIHELSGQGAETILESLLGAGATVKDVDSNGWTPLHYASQNNNLELMKALIKRGADVNASSNGGYRPLHLAARIHFFDPLCRVIKILLDAGADPKAQNKKGMTPAQLLREEAEGTIQKDLTAPQTLQDPTMVNKYREQVRKHLKLLDPTGPVFVGPKPTIVNGIRKLEPISMGDFSLERSVRQLASHTELILSLTPQTSNVPTVSISKLELDDYEPLGSQTVSVSKSGPTVVKFPKEAGERGAIKATLSSNTANDAFGEWGVSEGEGAPTMSRGREIVSFINNVPGRIMQIRLEKMTNNGKEIVALRGKILNCKAGVPCVIPGFKLETAGKFSVTFSYRYLPNKRWKQLTY